MYFNTILSETPKENTPKCWAICDSSDDKTMLLSTQLNGNKWCRGILSYNVRKINFFEEFSISISKQYNSDDKNDYVSFQGVIDFKPINLIELQSKHLSYVVKQYGPIEGMIDNYYRLGNDALLQVSRSVNGSMAQSILNDGKSASKMVLHQSIQVNNFKSIAKKFWIQLGILDDIKDTIVSYKETRDASYLTFKGHGQMLVFIEENFVLFQDYNSLLLKIKCLQFLAEDQNT